MTGHHGQLRVFNGREGSPGWDTAKARMPEPEMASLITGRTQLAERAGGAADQVMSERKTEAA